MDSGARAPPWWPRTGSPATIPPPGGIRRTELSALLKCHLPPQVGGGQRTTGWGKDNETSLFAAACILLCLAVLPGPPLPIRAQAAVTITVVNAPAGEYYLDLLITDRTTTTTSRWRTTTRR